MKKYIIAIGSICKLYRFNPLMILRFVHYNFFCANIHCHGGFFFPCKNLQIILDKTAVIELYGNLKVGIPTSRNSKVLSKIVIRANGRFCVNRRCDILEGCDVEIHNNGTFTVDDFHSNIGLEISCGYQIRLVGDVTAGRHVRLKDFNGHFVSSELYPTKKAIVIEDHVWICTGSSINPGVHIQTGTVVTDNSNVVSGMPPRALVHGNPAIVISKDIDFKI